MASATATTERSPAAALAWEAAQRPLAGACSILAGVLLLASNIIGAVSLKDSPQSTPADGLRDALGQALSTGEPGVLTPEIRYISDQATGLYAQATAAAIGTALVAVVLGYLFRATDARRDIPRIALFLGLLGPIASAAAPLLSRIGLVREANKYLDGELSTAGAHDVTSNSLSAAGSTLQIFVLLTAAAFVLISLNAMRAGLLTRFLGIMGIICGVLLILTLGSAGADPIIVEVFFLIALGLIILQKIPNVPPAWKTGTAVPWPSRLDQVAARDAAATRDDEDEDEDPDAPVGPDLRKAAPSTTAARKKKRKRR